MTQRGLGLELAQHRPQPERTRNVLRAVHELRRWALFPGGLIRNEQLLVELAVAGGREAEFPLELMIEVAQIFESGILADLQDGVV